SFLTTNISSLRITSSRWPRPFPKKKWSASTTTQKGLTGTTIGSTCTSRRCAGGLIHSLKDGGRKPGCCREASSYTRRPTHRKRRALEIPAKLLLPQTFSLSTGQLASRAGCCLIPYDHRRVFGAGCQASSLLTGKL